MSDQQCMNPACDQPGSVQLQVFGHPVGTACPDCTPFAHALPDYVPLEAIVRDLAGFPAPPSYVEETCWFCAAIADSASDQPAESCTYRRAVEWVQAHPEQT